MPKILFHKGYKCSNTRKCDLKNPEFPLLKKKVDKLSNTLDALFTTTAINGDNVIEQNSNLSLCDGSLLVCCHPISRPTTPSTTSTPTTISSNDKITPTVPPPTTEK